MSYTESMKAKIAFEAKQNAELAEVVQEMAHDIFDQCGQPDDYGVQHVGNHCIIFGGWNRVVLNSGGWSASESHCTVDFYDRFEKLFGRR